jgi:hypothetical protein
LWDYQNHGLPISFFGGVVNNRTIENDYDIKQFLRPLRIIVSRDYDEPHPIIYPGSKQFELIWNEVCSYLRDVIIENKIISKTAYSNEEWGNIVVKKSVLVNFPFTMDLNLLRMFLGVETSAETELIKLNKMVISFENSLNSEISVYITDGKKICKYITRPHVKADNNEILGNLVLSDNLLEGNSSNLFKEMGKVLNFRPDIPVYTDDVYSDYTNLVISIPQFLKIPENSIKNIEMITEKILGNDKKSYDIDVDNEDAIIFGNSSNIYKLNLKGLLEYTYVGNQDDSLKADLAKAFAKSTIFLNNKKEIIEMDRIYLSEIHFDSKKETYVFEYNYCTKEFLPIIISSGVEGVSQPMIRIEANSSRVLNASIILKEFKSSEPKHSYNLNFKLLSYEISSRFSKAERDTMAIENLFVGYYAKALYNELDITPSWIMEINRNVKNQDIEENINNMYFEFNLPQEKR